MSEERKATVFKETLFKEKEKKDSLLGCQLWWQPHGKSMWQSSEDDQQPRGWA